MTDQTADTDAQRNRRQRQREQDGREPASVNEMQDDAYDREPTYDGSDSTVNP